MRPEEVEGLLNEYGRHLASEDHRRYGGEECPQAWRFIDARRNPWKAEEETHFATGCPHCAKTREMLSRLEKEGLTAAMDMAPPAVTLAGFEAIFPGLSYLASRLGAEIAGINPFGFIDRIRQLDWSASSISFFPLATATGVAQPGHFGSEGHETSPDATESAAGHVEKIAEEADNPETREILLALAADLRNPGSGIARLKSLPGAVRTPEAALLLAIFYRRLGSREDAEDQLKRVIGILRKEM